MFSTQSGRLLACASPWPAVQSRRGRADACRARRPGSQAAMASELAGLAVVSAAGLRSTPAGRRPRRLAVPALALRLQAPPPRRRPRAAPPRRRRQSVDWRRGSRRHGLEVVWTGVEWPRRGADRHRRVRGGAAAGGRDGRGSEETEGKERREARKKMTGRPQQRAKQSFYLTSQLKMNSLLDAVCGRPNDAFAVCWEQIRVWRCALHKIMLSQCPVDKFPFNFLLVSIIRQVCWLNKSAR